MYRIFSSVQVKMVQVQPSAFPSRWRGGCLMMVVGSPTWMSRTGSDRINGDRINGLVISPTYKWGLLGL